MRQLVFTNKDAKQLLQQLLHPLILFQIEKNVQRLIEKGTSLVVLDIPLLVESSHWRSRVDRVLVVDCEEETQVQRVVQRSQLTPEAVRQIMAHQATRSQRMDAADMVVFNNNISMDQLRQQALQLNLHI
jgi:dephospho-CoA kinase